MTGSMFNMLTRRAGEAPPRNPLISKHDEGIDLRGEMASLLGSAQPSTSPTAPASPPQAVAPSPSAATEPQGRIDPSEAMQHRLEIAYLGLTGGRRNEAVDLARLRSAIPDMPRAKVDEGLARILKGDHPNASLMRHDDPRQVSKAMHEAAYSPRGEPFHVMWMNGR